MIIVSKKQGLIFIVSATVLLCAAFIRQKPSENEPVEEVKALDAKLLSDLQNQDIRFDDKSVCMLDCAAIEKSEILGLLDIKNVNYSKCEPGNCHYTNYLIEGKTISGKDVQFKVDSGEDGNMIYALQIEEQDCNCD